MDGLLRHVFQSRVCFKPFPTNVFHSVYQWTNAILESSTAERYLLMIERVHSPQPETELTALFLTDRILHFS